MIDPPVGRGRRQVTRWTSPGWWFGRCGRVHAALEAASPPPLDLVRHRVGQRGDGTPGPHHVAVAVQEPVELDQGQGAVTAQDREAGGTKVSARDGLGPFGGGRQGAGVDVRWPTSLRPRDRRVELVSQPRQGVDDGPAFVAEHLEAFVDLPEPVDEGVPIGLPFEPGGQAERGHPPQLVDRAATGGVDRSSAALPRRHEVGVGVDGQRLRCDQRRLRTGRVEGVGGRSQRCRPRRDDGASAGIQSAPRV